MIFSVHVRCTVSALAHLIVPVLPAAVEYEPLPPVTVTVPTQVSLVKLVDESAVPSCGTRLNFPESSRC